MKNVTIELSAEVRIKIQKGETKEQKQKGRND